MTSLGHVGVIGRFKPLHKGAAVMLEAVCSQAEEVVIGVGSSNRYNVRNPFTAEESHTMIDTLLRSRFTNYTIVHIPDFGHIPQYRDGQKWRQTIKETFGNLDHFVSGNAYVRDLLKEDYAIIHPADIIPSEKWMYLRATSVRLRMAQGGNWEELVPDAVAQYLKEHHLVERFRKEFGLETLASVLKEPDPNKPESAAEEHAHIGEDL